MMSLNDSFATTKVQLSEHIWLFDTGGTKVMLADKDGNGLVYGDVIFAGYTDSDETSLMVVYAPAIKVSDAPKNTLVGLKAAKADLRTGEVTEYPAVTQSELTRLQGIDVFINDQLFK